MMVSAKKVRLDQRMVQLGLTESRESAQRLILAGKVLVEEKPGLKASQKVVETDKIQILEGLKYASRGGLKLEKALDQFGVNPEGKTVLDIGASTGGFTDCLLQRNAKKVFAVDVGYGQLSWKLRHDSRVVVLERTNARFLTADMFSEKIDFAVMDLSFIGAHKILEPLRAITSEVILLLKPQFEAGPQEVPRGGVIQDPEVHSRVLSRFFRETAGWIFLNFTESPLLGGSGNREFLVHLYIDSAGRTGWTETEFMDRVKESMH